MGLPILYSFRRCPFAMRARMALLASARCCELREVALRDKAAELVEASAKGTVPVLVDVDGSVIEQSLDIMLWSLHGNDPLHWLPSTARSMDEARSLIGGCDGEFKQALDRYKYPDRYPGADRLRQRAIAGRFLAGLQARLEGRAWLGGAHAALADYAIMPFVRQFAMVEPDRFAGQAWPSLHRWLQALTDSPIFSRSMEKQEPWRSGRPGILFPASAGFRE